MRGLVAALLVLLLAAACVETPADSPADSPSPAPASEAVQAPTEVADPTPTPLPDGSLVAEQEGMHLLVTVDPVTVRQGDSVTITATLRNDRPVAVDYPGQWCGGATSVWITLRQPTEPEGREWTGIAGEFKEAALARGLGPGGVPALDPIRREVWPAPCVEGYRDEMLAAGASVTSTHVWKADLAMGIPALPGPVPLVVGANFELQNGPPSYPPDYDGPIGSWLPIYKGVGVSGVIEVEGERPDVLGPGEAIDSLLDDATFRTWLAEEPSSTWSNINLFLNDNRNPQGIVPLGVLWEVDLFRERGVPRHWAIAWIDAVNGDVRHVEYCNRPCDR